MISIKKLNKYYSNGNFHALKDVSLEIKRGEIVAIMGASGSGKSTLMNIIGLLDSWETGEYYFNEQPMNSLRDDDYANIRNKKIGFVFQSFNLIQHKTVLENVTLPLYYAGINKNERTKMALDILKRLGIEDKSNSLPNELSGGQKQRVAIARALSTNPELILADEPTGALDSVTSLEIMKLLKEINQTGVTIIIVTHDTNVAKFAERVITITDGEVNYE